MAKGIYIGAGNKARKVKKIYLGVGGKARKVKKGYIGVGGKARLFFSGGEASYYGTTTLSAVKRHAAGATAGNYALIAGGIYSSLTTYNTVDAYNKSLTRSTAAALSESKFGMAGAAAGSYAVFSGGDLFSGSYSNKVEAYSAALTRTSIESGTYQGIRYKVGGSVGDYAIFAGGENINGYCHNTAYAYTSALVETSLSALTMGVIYHGAAAVGDYLLFAGGKKSSSGDCVKYVYAYNSSLVKTSPTSLPDISECVGASVGGYAVFGCRLCSNVAYNSSLVQTTLTWTSTFNEAASLEKYAIFEGPSKAVAYDANLVLSDLPAPSITLDDASIGIHTRATATIGNYALFAGGVPYGSTSTDIIDVYTDG